MDLFDHADTSVGEFRVMRGVPVQGERSGKRNQKWKRPAFPFGRMQPGESFDCSPAQVGGAPLIVTQNIVSAAASTFARNCGTAVKTVFTTRQIRGEFVRCWRVS